MKYCINNPFRLLAALVFLAFLPFLAGCSDMMGTDSDDVAFEGDHKLDNSNDSIYSVMGVVAKLQKVADPCLLMGELRGDLMTTDNAYAVTDLQDINNLSISDGNAYVDKRPFYDIINNCNYILARMDTSITDGQTKVMMPEYAQTKTLRAWVYWQLAMMYGKVNYFTRPLLSVEDVDSAFTVMDLDALSQTLIDDLTPIADARPLDYGTVDGWSSSQFFLPAHMVLGDLYLYRNDYEQAARNYYSVIYNRGLTVTSGYANYWNNTTRTDLNRGHLAAYRNEVVSRIIFDSQLKSNHSQLLKLTYSKEPSLLPTVGFMENMNSRTHFHSSGSSISRYFDGDLRGHIVYGNGTEEADAFGSASVDGASPRTLITKFYNNLSGSNTDLLVNRPLTSLALVRPSTVYLRYAEALNRLGKHTFAFAVLKYGLKRATLSDTLRVDSNEVKDLPAYMDFTDSRFDANVGTAARGQGLGIQFDRAYYVIPDDVDSTEFVEKRILDELAAENCFEGNRFFDLLCVSRHRDNHPAYMASRVSQKFTDPQVVYKRLLNQCEWFAK